MREIGTLIWKLLAIALIAGLALGVVYAVTKEPIALQEVEAANAARRTVLPAADTFTLEEDGQIYAGCDASGAVVGYTLAGVCQGYGGEIEVTVGVDLDGVITGVNIGGTNFSETAGLGAETKKPKFYEQFAGMSGDIAIQKDGGEVVAVTSATISSRAVTNQVNDLCARLSAHIGG